MERCQLFLHRKLQVRGHQPSLVVLFECAGDIGLAEDNEAPDADWEAEETGWGCAIDHGQDRCNEADGTNLHLHHLHCADHDRHIDEEGDEVNKEAVGAHHEV